MLRKVLSLTSKSLQHALLAGFVLECLVYAQAASGQVSPSEILNPDLKALEENYLPQLKAISQSVAQTKFPFPFYLSRYVGLDPAEQAEADSRGLEFVRFRDRVLLKVSGNYAAAYDSARLTQNERAAGTFRAVVPPILHVLTAAVPQNLPCDGIGFEISYHTRARDRSYDYEGKEILVVVLDRDDAWLLSSATTDLERQEILNRSKVFVSGNDFGLALSERDPLNVQALPRSVSDKPDASSTARSATAVLRPSSHKTDLALKPNAAASSGGLDAPSLSPGPPLPPLRTAGPPASAPVAPIQKDADQLTEKYRSQLATLAKVGSTRFHFVDYAPPAFVVFRKQLALQVTLRNSLQFEPAKGSIYQRAAKSFDLFLAPQLKELLDNVPPELDFQLFDFSILNKLEPGPKGASEATEFICPREDLEQFVDAEMTNQQLLDHSVILVNGVRIALNLQLVE